LTPKTRPILGIRFIEAEQLGGADPIWILKFCVLLLDKATSVIYMENLSHISASLRDVVLRLDRMQADIARLTQQKVPDRFVPVLEATRHLHCGRVGL
jgi:hypothetical protein